jgi:hypothetical protein
MLAGNMQGMPLTAWYFYFSNMSVTDDMCTEICLFVNCKELWRTSKSMTED